MLKQNSRFGDIVLNLLRMAVALVLFIYPFIVYQGMHFWGIGVVAPILLIFFVLRLFLFRKQFKQHRWMSMIILVACLLTTLSWVMHQSTWLLYYPVVVNSVLLTMFGYSLYRPPTIIERFARIKQPELPLIAIRYTRNVTWIWCFFFVINGSVALFTCLWGDVRIWTLYNGVISYLIIGILLCGEWLIRKWFQH